MKKVLNHFKRVDPLLYQAAIKVRLLELMVKKKDHQDHFENLCEAIVCQQLSGKAAEVIYGRFKRLFPNEKPVPDVLFKLEDQVVRDIGMSWAKVKYVKDLSERVLRGEIEIESLEKLSDKDIMDELTKVKGIGPWTVEMYLMFTLAREDIFSVGDLGLKRGIEKIYGLSNPTKQQMLEMSAKWSPYRSYASRVLWKVLEQ